MTQQEIDDFQLYGCSSACLIKITELRRKPISREDFVEKYRDKFQSGQCGRLTLDKICEVALSLGFFSAVYSIRDPEFIKSFFRRRDYGNVLVLLDRSRDRLSGQLVSNFHCTLGLGWKDCGTLARDEVFLFYPLQDSAPTEKWYPFRELEERFVHFLILS